MRTIETKIYTFDELTERAKEKARDWWRIGSLDYEWWEGAFEEAERIGLKITEFDISNPRRAEGKLLASPTEICSLLLANHGETCGTYQFARNYFKAKRNGERTDTKEFTRALMEEYAIMLEKEYEYLLSDESVDESIRANEYEFTEDGKRA